MRKGSVVNLAGATVLAVLGIGVGVVTAATPKATPNYRAYLGGDTSRGNFFAPPGSTLRLRPGIVIYSDATNVWVLRLIIIERCSNGSSEPAVFDNAGLDKSNPLSGALAAHGHFSVTDARRGRTTVFGILGGNRGTATVRDTGPATGKRNVVCHGSHRFKLTQPSTRLGR